MSPSITESFLWKAEFRVFLGGAAEAALLLTALKETALAECVQSKDHFITLSAAVLSKSIDQRKKVKTFTREDFSLQGGEVTYPPTSCLSPKNLEGTVKLPEICVVKQDLSTQMQLISYFLEWLPVLGFGGGME